MSNGDPKTGNLNVMEVVNLANSFFKEVLLCQSANLTYVNAHDQKRIKAYTASLASLLSWITAQPDLDLPESTPMELPLHEFQQWIEPQNPMIATIARYFEMIRTETLNGQSSRQGTGIISHDEGRIKGLLTQIDAYLDNHVVNVNPIDAPESTPSIPITGVGQTGM